METAAVRSLVDRLKSLPDPRSEVNRLHLLSEVIVIAVCGVLVGCDGPTSIERWAKAKQDWLKGFLSLPHGVPSRDCLRRVLSLLEPEALGRVFHEWLAACFSEPTQRQKKAVIKHVAIDGKTLRRSYDKRRCLGPLHMVSAWASERGLSLGQLATDEKSNEITAIPELLEQIEVKGAVVTIDAMGCQTAIAEKVVKKEGDYVLAVKENQPKLHAAIGEFFGTHLEDDCGSVACRRYESHDQGHGREDGRYYYLAKLPKDFAEGEKWAGLKAIGLAVRVTRHADGRQTHDVRYYIASRYLSGEAFAAAVRGHWEIENSLHWVLDVTFGEDQSRARDRRLASNLAWLRRLAIGLLKRHPSKHSIKGKREIAGWDNLFLSQVLNLATG
jgi:predicted transposase YbfD/YdcC